MIKWLGHSTRAVNVKQITPSPFPPVLTQSTLATPSPPLPYDLFFIIPVDLINIVIYLNNNKTTKQEKAIARKLYLVSS